MRGPAPGSRETDLLAPDKPIARLDALLFTGGSAFGLAAADGVMRFLADAGTGFPTPVKPIPLVAASVIYDLLLSRGAAHPDADLGYAACRAARPLPLPLAAQGNAGAGAGASVGKWGGPAATMKGGVGYAERRAQGALVAALAVVNAVGDVVNEDGSVLAGARDTDGGWRAAAAPERWLPDRALFRGTNTTLVAVLTDTSLSKPQTARLAQRAHDGIARAVLPAHTDHDGDTTYALAAGTCNAPYDLVAAQAVALRQRGDPQRGPPCRPGRRHPRPRRRRCRPGLTRRAPRGDSGAGAGYHRGVNKELGSAPLPVGPPCR